MTEPKIGYRTTTPFEYSLRFPNSDPRLADVNSNGILDSSDTLTSVMPYDSDGDGYVSRYDSTKKQTIPVSPDLMASYCRDGLDLTPFHVLRYGPVDSWLSANHVNIGQRSGDAGNYDESIVFGNYDLSFYLSGDYNESTGACVYNVSDMSAQVLGSNLELSVVRLDGTVLTRTIDPSGKLLSSSSRPSTRLDFVTEQIESLAKTNALAGLLPDLELAIINGSAQEVSQDGEGFIVRFLDASGQVAIANITPNQVTIKQNGKEYSMMFIPEAARLYKLIPKLYNFG